MKKAFTIFILILTFSAYAEETDILPSAFPVSRYKSVWENSPFNREIVAQIIVEDQSAFATNLVLEGLVTDENEGAIAYVRDLREDTFLVVTSKRSDDSSLYLVNATKSNNPAETMVTISDGTETAEIKYADGIYTRKIDGPPSAPKKETIPESSGNAAEKPESGMEGDGTSESASSPEGSTGASGSSNSSDASMTEGSDPNLASPRGRGILLPPTRPTEN